MTPLRQGFAGREFPNIYRSFTEKIKKFRKKKTRILEKLKFQGLVTLYIVTTALILILSLDLLISLQKQKEINFEKEKIKSEIKLWEVLSEKYQGYKEAYYQLALLNYKIGEIDKAKYYVQKALYYDPGFEKARSLEQILKNY